MSDLWGSLPVIQDTESGIAAIEREQMTKPRPLDVEGPLLYQPSTNTYKLCDELGQLSKGFQIDELTRHTILLIQYNRKLQAKIQQMRLQIDSSRSGVYDFSDMPSTPPVPAAKLTLTKSSNGRPLRFIPRDEMSLFVRGFGKAPLKIDKLTTRRLLRQSCAAISAHAGYDTCCESTLETLTDVCSEFLLQMTSQLRTAVDTEAQHGDCGFPDAMSRVLSEMGCGDFTTLHEFYQSRVVGYHARTHQMAKSLYEQCERYRKADPSAGLLAVPKLSRGAEALDICFPSIEEADDDAENSYTGADTFCGHDSSGNASLTDAWKTDSHMTADERVMESDSHGDVTTYNDSCRPPSDFSSPATDIMSPRSQPLNKRLKRT